MSTPWAEMLRLSALRLRVAPDAFWRLSLKEWRALTGGDLAPSLDRAGLDALAALYPDTER